MQNKLRQIYPLHASDRQTYTELSELLVDNKIGNKFIIAFNRERMNLKVLIVEDEPTMRIVIKQVLTKINLHVKQIYEAENGKEGLNVLKRNHIDLILTDIDMPEMNGLEMLSYIQTHPHFDEVPTIVISSINDKRLVNAVIDSGMGYVQKPLTVQLLNKQLLSLKGYNYEARAQAQNF